MVEERQRAPASRCRRMSLAQVREAAEDQRYPWEMTSGAARGGFMLEQSRWRFISLWFVLELGIAALALSGCNGSQSSPSTLTSIQITPANPSVASGSTQQFAARGAFSDGSTADVTASVGWSSSDTTRATISSSGLATAAAIGRPQIIATSGAVTSSTRLIIVRAATPTVARFAYVAGNVDG